MLIKKARKKKKIRFWSVILEGFCKKKRSANCMLKNFPRVGEIVNKWP